MGYDMYLIKVDKSKIKHSEGYMLYEDINNATINEVNSYYPVLSEFY